MCVIPYDKTFHAVSYFFFTLWPWHLTYFWKTLTYIAHVYSSDKTFHMAGAIVLTLPFDPLI